MFKGTAKPCVPPVMVCFLKQVVDLTTAPAGTVHKSCGVVGFKSSMQPRSHTGRACFAEEKHSTCKVVANTTDLIRLCCDS